MWYNELMKKIVATLIAILLPFFALFGCGNVEKEVLFVVPDGAPALSVASLLLDEFELGGKTEYKVVSSTNVENYFATKRADAGVLPLNLATKMTDYQIVSINTFGNLYVIGTSGQDILSLKGHTLHVINLNNVVGLTVRLALTKCGIDYTMNDLQGSSKNVVLKGANASDLAGAFSAGKIKFAVVAEPLCSKLMKMNTNLKIIADVQELYGKYPQSAMVVQKGKFTATQVNALIAKMRQEISQADAFEAINTHLEKGVVSAFSADGLEGVMARCNVGFMRASENKDFINDYIEKIIALQENSAQKLTDDRFYV